MAFYYLLLLSRCGVDFICIPSKLFLLLFYVNHQHITAGFFSLMCVQVFLFSFVVVVSGQKFNVFSCPLSHTIRFNTNQMNTIIYIWKWTKKIGADRELCCISTEDISADPDDVEIGISHIQMSTYCYILFFHFLIIWHFKSPTLYIIHLFFYFN